MKDVNSEQLLRKIAERMPASDFKQWQSDLFCFGTAIAFDDGETVRRVAPTKVCLSKEDEAALHG